MEAYVALHQADELQGIIGEIKVEKHVVWELKWQSFCRVQRCCWGMVIQLSDYSHT